MSWSASSFLFFLSSLSSFLVWSINRHTRAYGWNLDVPYETPHSWLPFIIGYLVWISGFLLCCLLMSRSKINSYSNRSFIIPGILSCFLGPIVIMISAGILDADASLSYWIPLLFIGHWVIGITIIRYSKKRGDQTHYPLMIVIAFLILSSIPYHHFYLSSLDPAVRHAYGRKCFGETVDRVVNYLTNDKTLENEIGEVQQLFLSPRYCQREISFTHGRCNWVTYDFDYHASHSEGEIKVKGYFFTSDNPRPSDFRVKTYKVIIRKRENTMPIELKCFY